MCVYVRFIFGVLTFNWSVFSQLPEGGTVLTNMPESSTETCQHLAETSVCDTAESASSGQWFGKTFTLHFFLYFS